MATFSAIPIDLMVDVAMNVLARFNSPYPLLNRYLYYSTIFVTFNYKLT